MLTKPGRSLLGFTVAILLIGTTLMPARSASASGVTCLLADPESGLCRIEATWEQASDGAVVMVTTAGGSDLVWCERPRRTVAGGGEGPAVVLCEDVNGWYSYRYDCYFDGEVAGHIDPMSPDAEVVFKEGTRPGDDGAVYMVWCYLDHFRVPDGWFAAEYWFLPSPPDGYGGTPDPTADLIVQAFNELGLRGPEIGTAPPETGAGLVGMPVWLWTEVSDQTWGEPEASASAGGVTVTARAQARKIDWHMGDGRDPVTCDAGRAWRPGDDPGQPACGYVYAWPSRELPGGRYEITGVTTWEVTWSVAGGPSDGLGGTVTLTPQSPGDLPSR